MSPGLSYGPQRHFINPEDYDTPQTTVPARTIAVYVFLSVLSIYYLFQYLDFYPLLPLHELLWNCLVYITPASLVLALDRRKTKPGISQDHSQSRNFAAKSETMRHLLGLDAGSTLIKFQRPRSLSSLSSVFKPSQNDGLPGLGNWDNSCYQNSVLQGLASLHSVRAFLDQGVSSSSPNESAPTREALRTLIGKLNDPRNGGKRLWTPAELKSMSSWQQQDAQEYFSKILDEIEKETTRSAKHKFTTAGLLDLGALDLDAPEITGTSSARPVPAVEQIIHKSKNRQILGNLPEELASFVLRNPLEGLLAQRVGCLNCGYVEGLSLIPFNCLTLPLGKQWTYQIQSCLDNYTDLESINGVECSKCTLLKQRSQLERLLSPPHPPIGDENAKLKPQISEALMKSASTRLMAVNEALENDDFSENTLLKKCHVPTKSRVTTTKSRQAVIARAPKALVLHVNRSVFDEHSGMLSKNHANIRFPQHLDLSPWCLGGKSQDYELETETWSVDPSKSMLSADEAEDGKSFYHQSSYRLQAVVTHYGRHENGHYICYRESPRHSSQELESEGSLWWRLSDDDVSQVSQDNVLAQGGVFMLFYERLEKSFTAMPKRSSDGEVVTSKQGSEDDRTAATVAPPEASDVSNKPIPPEEKSDVGGPARPAGIVTPANDGPRSSLASNLGGSSTTTQHGCVEAPGTQDFGEATSTFAETEDFQTSKPSDLEGGAEIHRTAKDGAVSRKENAQISPLMRTSAARDKRGSVGRAGKTIASVSSMITAN